ncbi:unnamed protein product [Phaedon cochleariae]|uniref:Hydroxymethylglutaryl-CoA synthase n=1 Tax=Phaedon cochleariae TaxID=80249 RepID=A0A9P0DRA6_PHACE|nr:unnamed protein product [Phaedon cochleariae]
MAHWPEDVGILAIELIVPSVYVDQTELEAYDGVSAGKYTIGLGQQKMGFCSNREDINSLCLTVVQKLMERHNIQPSEIGRLEVGTETIIDKSKSVKTVLMQLFEPHGVTDIEGVDSTNACYGGTAALLNSIAWIESSSWNGRFALVVAADIAVYAKGGARPTGGAGAVAMLIGPNAPLVFDRGTRASYVKHAYDFYKPDLTSEYPVVDGKLSIQCYLGALDNTYQLYKKNVAKREGGEISLQDFDGVLFHSPYCKLVQKSLARLALNDFVQASSEDRSKKFPGLEKFENVSLENSYFDREVEQAFVALSKEDFKTKTTPSLLVASQVGNMYTASLYGGLVSYLVSKDITELVGNKIMLYSYGSGLAASIFSMTFASKIDERFRNLISNLSHVKGMLQQRQKVDPKIFEDTLQIRHDTCHSAPFEPNSRVDDFFPGTYYLVKIDDKHRRFYERMPVARNGHA